MKPEKHRNFYGKNGVFGMEDYEIVNMYWARDEKAIEQSDTKYGRMLRSLSYSVLSSWEDAEECVNDTYLDAWGAMPEARPTYLGAFLSKITRRISIDRFRKAHRQKRGGLESIMAELSDCIPSDSGVVEEYENGRLAEVLNSFLYSQEKERRVMFVRRYFCSQSVSEIAHGMNLSESKIKTTLFRMREELRRILEEQELL